MRNQRRLGGENIKTEDYAAVKKWFGKRRYAEATEKVYIEHLKVICEILNKTPDELVEDIKKSEDPMRELEDQQVKLASIMRNNMMNRSIAQYLNMLHSFYRSNGIRLTPEVVRQLTDKTETMTGIRFRT